MKLPKYLLAGSGEKVQYLVHNFNDNTIRFVLHYPGKVKAEILRDAAKALVDSVDILHASFRSGGLNAYWCVNRTYDTKDYFTYIETDKDPEEPALAVALNPVLPEGAVQLHCTLVQGIEEAFVTLRVSHLCVDGGDGKYLLGKLVEAYNMLYSTGTTEKLQVKNGSRAAEQVYKELSTNEIFSLLKNPLSGVKMSFPFQEEENGREKLYMVHRSIPVEVLAAARYRAKEKGATINDVLLAAYYRAYASMDGVKPSAPLSIMSMMDLRHHCKNGESEGLANVSGSMLTVLKEGVQGSFSDTLHQIKLQTRAAKENPLSGMEGMPLLHGATHLPMGLLLRVAERVYGGMSLGLTNLGILDSDGLMLGGLRPNIAFFGGPLKKKPSVQVCAASLDGKMELTIVGEYTEDDEKILQDLLDKLEREIEEFAEEG